ncbi:DUF5706 domain-containing protein (plasmid) [Nocardia sp. NBC_01377]|uniref:Pycsar system effector family protein n=1 Tax=Nocardia sp. NBC_01377 TaxID=2903595 RepID=UPI002F9152B2
MTKSKELAWGLPIHFLAVRQTRTATHQARIAALQAHAATARARTAMADRATQIDTGWRIHAAILDWMSKIDAKASFTLTLDGVLLIGGIALSKDPGTPFHELSGVYALLFRSGCILLFVSAASALIVLFPGLDWRAIFAATVLWIPHCKWLSRHKRIPQYKAKKLRKRAEKNFIFFGNLQACDEEKIAEFLTRNVEPVLAVQLSRISKIAARKHLFVQCALMCVLLGISILALTYALAPTPTGTTTVWL